MMTRSRTLAVAFTLVVGLLIGVYAYLVRSSGPKAAVDDAPAAHVSASPQAVPRKAGQAKPRVLVSDGARRELFAQRLESLFARKGQQIRVEASGADGKSFHMSWPSANPDKEHIEQLKRAEPFHRELRAQGFSSLVLKIGPRVVWSKEL